MNRKNIKRFLFWIRLKKVYSLLPKKLKQTFLYIIILILFTSFIDLIGLALLIPLILLLLEDNYISNTPSLDKLYHFLEFESEVNFSIFILLSIFILIIVKNVSLILLTRKQTKLAMYIQAKISTLVLQNYLHSNILELKRNNSNHIIWEINTLPMHFIRFLILPLALFFNEVLVATTIGITLFFYDPKIILLLTLTTLPITFYFYRLTKNKIQKNQKELSLISPKVNALTQQSVFGYIDIILTNSKEYYTNQYKKHLNKSIKLNVKIFTLMSIPSKIIEVAIISAMTILIIIALKTNLEKQEILNFLGLFAIAAYKLIPSLNKITVSTLSFKSYQFTLNHLSKTLSNKTFENNSTPKQTEVTFNEKITINNLSFEYKKNEPILNALTFDIHKGETIGIIGKSGSGKTTLMNILLGLYNSTQGTIKIDNSLLSKTTKESWYRKIGYVQQNIFLLDASIKENIAFGTDSNEINIEKINQAIDAANLSELIESLPHGINTKVGELGNLISGGQKQRIGIARALYSNAEVLLFDEATSALDNETEQQITQTLSKLSEDNKKLTIIVIAHRYSTLQNCDRIIELENGKIKSIKQYNDLEH